MGYVISAYVDFNNLLIPNPRQLSLKLDSCAQRCQIANFSAEYGGEETICRRVPQCEELVSRLLDERVRVPLVDGWGPVTNKSVRPRSSATIADVSMTGAECLQLKVPRWVPPWQR